MDEPFASLDDEKRAEMRDLLRSLLTTRETTLILVTHSREDALDLARRVLVLDSGKTVANDLLENVLARPQHVAAARAFGLGQIVSGTLSGPDKAQTAFGVVSTIADRSSGPVKLLVRPRQPEISRGSSGVEGVVVAVELRPPELREVGRVALVSVGENFLRIPLNGLQPSIGDRVCIEITGPCEILDQEPHAP